MKITEEMVERFLAAERIARPDYTAGEWVVVRISVRKSLRAALSGELLTPEEREIVDGCRAMGDTITDDLLAIIDRLAPKPKKEP